MPNLVPVPHNGRGKAIRFTRGRKVRLTGNKRGFVRSWELHFVTSGLLSPLAMAQAGVKELSDSGGHLVSSGCLAATMRGQIYLNTSSLQTYLYILLLQKTQSQPKKQNLSDHCDAQQKTERKGSGYHMCHKSALDSGFLFLRWISHLSKVCSPIS